MRVFDNLKIRTKSLIPPTVMVIFIALVVAVGSINLTHVSDSAKNTITGTDPALLQLARANRTLNAADLNVYEVLSYPTAGVKPVVDAFTKNIATINDLFAKAVALLPSRKAELEALLAEYKTIEPQLQSQVESGSKTNGFTLGSKNTPADMDLAAELASKQIPIDGQVQALSDKIKVFTDEIVAQSAAEAEQLASESDASIWTMLGMGLTLTFEVRGTGQGEAGVCGGGGWVGGWPGGADL